MIVRLLHGTFGLSSTATGTISSRIIQKNAKVKALVIMHSVTTASAVDHFAV